MAPESRRSTVIGAVVSLVVLAAVFLFLFPRFADYGAAFDQMLALSPWWIAALVAASVVNIGLYPLTEIAAIPRLAYRAAFTSRQAAFTISNIIPGGGAVAVATQYSILAGYRVSPAMAAAAVSADGAWTYLIGLGIVIGSVAVISVVLRSEQGARRLGSWAQRVVDRLYRVVKKPAPDVTSPAMAFHTNAAAMVGERWRSLTVTNVVAQFTPLLVLGAALAGLGVLGHPVTVIEVFAAYSIALLLTMFPLTPGGLGTVDAALVALLVGFGADSSTALAADLIWRLVWFLPQLLVGLLALGIYRWDRRRAAS